jgi:DNA-binding NtrC family response regulator
VNILIVEDDPHELAEVRTVCLDEDSVQTAENLRDAKEALLQFWPETVILDAVFPSIPCANPGLYTNFNAGKLLEALRERKPKGKRLPDVILISGAPEAAEHFSEIAPWLTDGTLYDVIPKAGFSSWGFFRQVLGHKLSGLRRDRPFAAVMSNAKTVFEEMEEIGGIVTRHPSMLRVWDRIKQHAEPANQGANFYVWGEPGVGKELVARAVAKLKKTDCLTYNCNVNHEVFYLEIFGSCVGAFTTAVNRAGLIERAQKGVLFLDQFCSISDNLQRQLLRVLESDARDYQRMGGQIVKAECKFVIADTLSPEAASHAAPADAKRMIAELFSRVQFGGVEIPPLRDRQGDIALLTRKFLGRFNSDFNKRVELDAEILDRFTDGRWPGNVRALRDVVRNLVSAFSGRVGWDDICRLPDGTAVQSQLDKPGGGAAPTAVSVTATPQPASPVPRRLGINDEKDLKDMLLRILSPKGAELVEALDKVLRDRVTPDGSEPRNDPGRHLFYAALLFLAQKAPDHQAGSVDLKSELAISKAHVHNLCTEMKALFQGPLAELCRCEGGENTRFGFQMPRAVIR